jgi:hypothetical protein
MFSFAQVVERLCQLYNLDTDGRNRLEWWLRDYDVHKYDTIEDAVKVMKQDIEDSGETVVFITQGLFT